MRSNFYFAFAKVFCVASWLSSIIPIIGIIFLLNGRNVDIVTLLIAAIVPLICAALTIVFYSIYKHIANIEDFEIIEQLDEEIRGIIDEHEKNKK